MLRFRILCCSCRHEMIMVLMLQSKRQQDKFQNQVVYQYQENHYHFRLMLSRYLVEKSYFSVRWYCYELSLFEISLATIGLVGSPLTTEGMFFGSRFPVHSWPSELRPKVYTLPVSTTTQEWVGPRDMSMTRCLPSSLMGVATRVCATWS